MSVLFNLAWEKLAPRNDEGTMAISQLATAYGRMKLYVNGEWKESVSGQIQNVFDPGRGRVIAEVPFAKKEEVNEAVDSAQTAFEKWSDLPITERVKYLFRMKQVFEEHLDELAAINTQNHGKTLDESKGDLKRTIENIDAAIAVAYSLAKGETQDQIAPDIDEMMVKEPLGVYAIVCPFNFPLMIPFWFIPYAIVLGDTVIVKPSEITPLPMEAATKLMHEKIKLPPGILNLVHGGREVVESLIANSKVKGVTFVGSTPVAKQIYRLAGEHGKRAIANGGAKNSIVVMPDADLDRSIPPIVSSFFGNAGQRCLAGANLITVGKAHQEALKKFANASSRLKVSYGLDSGTEMGPVVTSKARDRILAYLETGLEEGAKLALDGRSLKVLEYPEGFYLGPTILDEVSPDMRISKEEIFGPVASAFPVETLDEAIDLINWSTNYGNMACIFTSSGRSARAFRRRVNAGNIGINLGVAAPAAHFPFGGRKESFFGVLHAQTDAVDFFTDKKVTISRW